MSECGDAGAVLHVDAGAVMICPHCKSDEQREAVVRVHGDYYCDRCAPEIYAALKVLRELREHMSEPGLFRLPKMLNVHRAIAGIEVGEQG